MAAVAVPRLVGDTTVRTYSSAINKADIVQVETKEYVPSDQADESDQDRGTVSRDSIQQQEKQGSPTTSTTATAAKLADWVKNQEAVPYWARIYPVDYPPFDQQAQGHPQDRHAPHPDEQFPASQVGPEERTRRANEVNTLAQINEVKRPLDEE